MTTTLPSLLIAITDGVIDLGWGHPSARLHPLEALQQATAATFAQNGVAALQYGAEQGSGPLLQALALFLSTPEAYAMSVDPGSLFVTAGASQALDLTCTLFTRQGGTVFVEEPTYYLVQRIFADHRLDVVGVPTDTQGLRTDVLAALLRDTKTPPVLLYTIPTFQNPAGSVLPAERRQELVELAQRYQFLVAADEVYHLLHYGTPPPPPLMAFDHSPQGCVISLGSFSKILAPGLRLGWVQAHPQLIRRFVQAGFVASGGGINHFTAMITATTLTQGLLAQNLAMLRATYGERVAALSQALRRYIPEAQFQEPAGGYFVWITLPPEIDTAALLPLAQQCGLSFRPGPAFSAAGAFANALRLSFALYEVDDLVEGIKRLARALAMHRPRQRSAVEERRHD